MRIKRIQSRTRAGFTFLEALTVLLIIGILSSFAFLAYGTYRRALRAKSTAQQLEALLGAARTMAINQNAHTQAVIDLSTSGLWIDQTDSAGNVLAPKVTTPDSWSSLVRMIDVSVNGTSFTNSLVRIRFHPDGTSDAARIVLLSVGTDSRGTSDTRTLKLYSSTARTRTFPGTRP